MSKVYVLRNCKENMSSYDDFVWPKSGHVKCPDWSERKECGNGLHGFLWGIGDTTLLYPLTNCQWLIVEVDEDKIIDLGDKVKFPEGNIVFCTQSRDEAIEKMIEYGANPNTIMYGTSTSGDFSTSTSGNRGTSTSGKYGKSTSGNCGTSTSGHHGTSTSGDFGTSISGDRGKSISGDRGTSTSGHGGNSTSGHGGNSTSGNGGTSTSDYVGTSTSGNFGTSISGYKGTSISKFCGYSISIDGKAKSGDKGVIAVGYYCSISNKRTIKVGHVPEELKPNTFYKVVNGKWVETD